MNGLTLRRTIAAEILQWEPPSGGRSVVYLVNSMRMELAKLGAGRLSTRIWMDREGLNIEMTDRYSVENEERYSKLEREFQYLRDRLYHSGHGVTIAANIPMYNGVL